MASVEELVNRFNGKAKRCHFKIIIEKGPDASAQVFGQLIEDEFSVGTNVTCCKGTSQSVFFKIRIAEPSQGSQKLIP